MRSVFRLRPLVKLALAAPLALVSAAQAQPSFTPYQWVRQLDFECRPAAGPPLPNTLIRQLNPVIDDVLPDQAAVLGNLEEVCVPVAKNGQIPPLPVRNAIEWADLACYAASAPDVDVDVALSHLNPVLANLPDETVTLKKLRQLCVPVRKNNNQDMPPPVRDMLSHFDVACYELAQPTTDVSFPLGLGHLNPVIRAMGIPNHPAEMKSARQLCVPVAKNDQPVPAGIRAYVRWADFLKYRIETPPLPPIPLFLTHMNPAFAALPGFPTVLQPEPARLMVPVAKNGVNPPGGPAVAD